MQAFKEEAAQKALLAKQEYDAKLQELARQAEEEYAKFEQQRVDAESQAAQLSAQRAAEQAAHMEAHKSKMEKIRADANEKARIAQEKYQQEIQE